MSIATDTAKALLKAGLEFASNAVIAAAVTALPILGIPGINQVFKWGVNWVVGKLTPFLENFLTDKIIDIQVNAEKNAFAKARDELQAVLKTHVRDPKELQNASDEFDSRLANLIRIRP